MYYKFQNVGCCEKGIIRYLHWKSTAYAIVGISGFYFILDYSVSDLGETGYGSQRGIFKLGWMTTTAIVDRAHLYFTFKWKMTLLFMSKAARWHVRLLKCITSNQTCATQLGTRIPKWIYYLKTRFFFLWGSQMKWVSELVCLVMYFVWMMN